jgi:hypothetical protein
MSRAFPHSISLCVVGSPELFKYRLIGGKGNFATHSRQIRNVFCHDNPTRRSRSAAHAQQTRCVSMRSGAAGCAAEHLEGRLRPDRESAEVAAMRLGAAQRGEKRK